MDLCTILTLAVKSHQCISTFFVLLLTASKKSAMLEGFHQEEMLGKKRKEWMIKEGDEKIG